MCKKTKEICCNLLTKSAIYDRILMEVCVIRKIIRKFKIIVKKRRQRMDAIRAKKQIKEFSKVPSYSIRSNGMIQLGVECILSCRKEDLSNKKKKVRIFKHREE